MKQIKEDLIKLWSGYNLIHTFFINNWKDYYCLLTKKTDQIPQDKGWEIVLFSNWKIIKKYLWCIVNSYKDSQNRLPRVIDWKYVVILIHSWYKDKDNKWKNRYIVLKNWEEIINESGYFTDGLIFEDVWFSKKWKYFAYTLEDTLLKGYYIVYNNEKIGRYDTVDDIHIDETTWDIAFKVEKDGVEKAFIKKYSTSWWLKEISLETFKNLKNKDETV